MCRRMQAESVCPHPVNLTLSTLFAPKDLRPPLFIVPYGTPSVRDSANNNVSTEALARIFDRPDGKQWDYVLNCGGETRYSQEDEVYRLRSLGLSLALGKEAAKRGIKCFVELSTGMVYKPDSSPSKEQDKLKPWSKIAVFKLQAEEELAKIEG